MRSWIVQVLLLVIGFSSIGPLLLATSTEEDVPACCRRDGKHRCAMRKSADLPVNHLVLRSPQSKCPQCPNGSQSTASPKLDASIPSFVPLSTHLVVALQTRIDLAEAHRRISDLRSAQKRGPPQFSL